MASRISLAVMRRISVVDTVTYFIYLVVMIYTTETMIGRHIMLCGPSSSGKTTVSKTIANIIGVPHIELDAIFWKPDWIEKPLKEFRMDVSTLIDTHKEGWVFDGNYARIRDIILPYADTVIWLRLPLRVVFWRMLCRTISRIRSREPLWGYNYETVRKAFFSRDSLLLYILMNWRRHFRTMKRSLEGIPHHASLIELHSQKDIDEFLRKISLV